MSIIYLFGPYNCPLPLLSCAGLNNHSHCKSQQWFDVLTLFSTGRLSIIMWKETTLDVQQNIHNFYQYTRKLIKFTCAEREHN